jgi:GTP-binding protein EngB required for normal cell division
MRTGAAADLAAYKQSLLTHLTDFEASLGISDIEKIFGPMLLTDMKAELERVRKSLDYPFSVAVIGHFKYGKSTLVNALLRKEISPIDILPETYAITDIRYGSKEEVLAYLADSTVKNFSLKDLRKEQMLKNLEEGTASPKILDEPSLRDEIYELFDLAEIESICFDLEGIDFEDLPKSNKGTTIERLIIWCRRRDTLQNLIDICQKKNPRFNLDNIYTNKQSNTPPSLIQLAHQISKIEVKAPLGSIKGMRLIDTPGIGDTQKMDERIQASLPTADVVVFVLLARALLSQEEGNFLERAIDKYDHAKFIFVVNQMDSLAPDQIERVKKLARDRIRPHMPNASIYYLSAYEEFELVQNQQIHLESTHFHDAFLEFRAHINQAVHLNRGVMQLERAVCYLESLLNHYETQVAKIQLVYQKGPSELGQIAEKMYQPNSEFQNKIQTHLSNVKQEIENLNTQADGWMDEFVDRLLAETIPSLSNVKIKEIKQEFHLFLASIVSQAMNACFNRQRPIMLEVLYDAQESIRRDYEAVLKNPDYLSLEKIDQQQLATSIDWEKLDLYNRFLEKCLASVFSFNHELMDRVIQILDSQKNLPEWQALANYKNQLIGSTPE